MLKSSSASSPFNEIQSTQRVRIEDNGCEKFRNKIQCLIKENSEIVAEKTSKLGKAKGTK